MSAPTRIELLDALLPQVNAFATRLAPVYLALHWEWARGPIDQADRCVPDRWRLADTLCWLITNVRQHGGASSSGGLTVEVTDTDARMLFDVGYIVEAGDEPLVAIGL